MAFSSPESNIFVEAIKHMEPGKYAQRLFNTPSLNPFHVRVRSREYHYPLRTNRHTVIWVHESSFPLSGSFGLALPTKRTDTEQGTIFEQIYVVATDHSGLQKNPRRFDEMTRRSKLALT